MNNSSWKKKLNQTLKTTVKNKGRQLKLALVGIGNEMNGDDAAGVIVVQNLAQEFSNSEYILLINGAIAPENYCGKIANFEPDIVILIDAADMDLTPGAITLLPWDQTTGFSASTHTLPPYVMAEYLTKVTDCQVLVIGVQPQSINFADPITPPVELAVKEITGEFKNILSPA